MTSSVNASFAADAMEYLYPVWTELTMAIFGMIGYLMLSRGSAIMSKGSSKKMPSAHRHSEQEPTLCQMATKALREGKLKEAVALVRQLPGTKAGRVPANVAFRLLTTVSRVSNLDEAISELMVLKGSITSGPLEAAISHALKSDNSAACHQLHRLANALSISKSMQTFQTLAHAYAGWDAVALTQLVEEAPLPLQSNFAQIVLEACAVVKVLKESNLAARVLQKVSSADAAILRKGARSPVSLAQRSPNGSEGSSSNHTSPRDISDEGVVSLRDVPVDADAKAIQALSRMRANDIRSCGRNGDLAGALKVFDRLDKQTADTTLVMNSMVDACVCSKDLDQAVIFFKQARSRKIADTITYNTMIKGYLAAGQESAAKQILNELFATGVTTRPSYHGLLNARVNAGDLRGAWKIVAEMQLAEIVPNAVTCAILLKCKAQSQAEVSKVLALVDAMEEPMDEVLFQSVVEACIRTKSLDALTRQMNKFMRQGKPDGLTASTYGSIIKAFGNSHNTKQVWNIWNEMIHHKVLPTSVTLGCMVEALVANGCTSDAWQLVHQMWSQVNTRSLVNTVIYSSILKGFASAREIGKVMGVYEEMKSLKIQPNRITYNSIMNAFAQNGQMERMPALLEDMKAAVPPVKPDVVTYSTIVKGFCNSGSLDRALQVVQDMKADGSCMPDEVTYNCLLSGCAKEFRCEDALQILADMKESGIAPSNYTLSMLVKLMGRSKRINQAFTMLEDISSEHRFQINIQVYTCLIQGCFNCGQPHKALEVHNKIIKEGLRPDAMTYSVLVKGCLQAGLAEKASDLAKVAFGRDSAKIWSDKAPGLNAGCIDEVVAALGGSEDERAHKLLDELAGCCEVQSSWYIQNATKTKR